MSRICKFLDEEIHFASNRIVPCGSSVWDNEGINAEKYFIKPDIEGENTDFQYYFKKRNKYIEMFKNEAESGIPEFCKHCEKFVPKEYNANTEHKHKFLKINIYNRSTCNCKCVYCCLANYGDESLFIKNNSEKTYDIKPILSKMDELNIVEDGVEIAIFGGECTTYPEELDYIVNWGEKYNAKFIILSNGIIYNKTFERLAKSGNVEFRFSIDCGTKEKFEEIKRVKVFDQVVNNIEKYCKLSKSNSNAVIQLRYLLCPSINDDIKYIKDFFELALKLDVDLVILGFERFWIQKNTEKPIPLKIKQIIKYYLDKNNYKNLKRDIDTSDVYDYWYEKLLKEINTPITFNFYEWLITKLHINSFKKHIR